MNWLARREVSARLAAAPHRCCTSDAHGFAVDQRLHWPAPLAAELAGSTGGPDRPTRPPDSTGRLNRPEA